MQSTVARGIMPVGPTSKSNDSSSSSRGAPSVQLAADAPVQRKNTIVDDKSDATNTKAPGTGRGVVKTDEGKLNPFMVFGGLVNECGTSASGLIIPGDSLAGSEPKAGTWPSWWTASGPSDTNYWVRGHLMNHNLGGPGEKRNLTPITKKMNSAHHNLVEKVCKVAAEKGKALAYTITAVYGGGPSGLKGDATDPDKSVWPLITTGFQCDYIIHGNNGDIVADVKTFIPNTR